LPLGNHGIDHNAGYGASERQVLAVLQCTEHLIDGVVIGKRRNSTVIDGWSLLALTADARVGECSSARQALRIKDKRQLLPAIAAKAAPRLRLVVTKQAIRWRYPLQCRPSHHSYEILPVERWYLGSREKWMRHWRNLVEVTLTILCAYSQRTGNM